MRLYLPAIVFGLWAGARACGAHGQWVAVAFLTALAISYGVAEVERKHHRG